MIPCFNTHIYIKDLINKLRKNTNLDILIFDDGSSPKLELNDKYDDVKFLRNARNRGKGYCLQKGLKYSEKNKYTHAITLDGDMQHSPYDIDKFINEDPSIDFLFGCRNFYSPMPFIRILSNKITSVIISLFKNVKIIDSQCGFRRYKISSLNLKKTDTNGYLYETELILNSLNKDMLIKNINIKTIYNDSKSNINSFRDTIGFINLIFRYIVA